MRTNIRYIFGEKGATEADMPPRLTVSLVNQPLPDFEDIKVNLQPNYLNNRMVIVCFFDMNQRPSRNCITRLAKQTEQLGEKSATIVAIHASKIEERTLNECVRKNEVPFPVGTIRNNETKTRFLWGIKSLPWLILTNCNHVVTAEGFGLDELEDKIRQAGGGK
jgi:hypothetical protein